MIGVRILYFVIFNGCTFVNNLHICEFLNLVSVFLDVHFLLMDNT